LYVGSSHLNSIQELSYDFEQHQLLFLLREKKGLRGNIKHASFVGLDDDPLSHINVLAVSDYEKAEMRFISLQNENMSQTFSTKINKKAVTND
jgi:hypothetical protein